MKIADAHCDTLTEFKEEPFFSPTAQWNLDKFADVGGLLQYFAICTPPELCGDSAMKFAFNSIGHFFNKKPENISLIERTEDYNPDKVNIVLALEGGSPIINDIANLYAFHKLGIRAVTLTWNHRNFLGDGNDDVYGLTNFGKEVVKEMEKLKIIVDVSHLNEKGFEDVLKVANKPFMASHSNCYSLCDAKRNLKDEQIIEIRDRGGFIGINFYSGFIGGGSDMKYGLLSHIEHYLKLECGDILGLGSDFDGMDDSPYTSVSQYPVLYKLIKDEMQLSSEQLDKFFYKNLVDFTLKSLA